MPRRDKVSTPEAPATRQDRLLTPEEVAGIFAVRVNTLARWRCDGVGPAYLKIGSLVRYRKEDLERYVATSIVPR